MLEVITCFSLRRKLDVEVRGGFDRDREIEMAWLNYRNEDPEIIVVDYGSSKV